MSQPSPSTLNFSRIHLSLMRQKRPVLLLFLTIMSGITAFTFLSPKSYRSQAKLFIRLGRENVTLDPTATFSQSPVVVVPPSRESEMTSVLEIIRSRALLGKVVQHLGAALILGKATGPIPKLDREPPPSPDNGTDPGDPEPERVRPTPPPSAETEDAIRYLAKHLSTEVVKKSNIVSISYEGQSPEMAQAVVTLLVDCYLDRHAEAHRPSGAQTFLAEQTRLLYSRLAASEEDLKSLRQKTGLYAPAEQKEVLVRRIGSLEEELLQIDREKTSLVTEVKTLQEQIEQFPKEQITARTTGVANEAMDRMRDQLFTLQLKEQEMLARHPRNHPEVVAIRAQAEAARAILAKETAAREEITTGPHRLREAALLTLARHQPRIDSLKEKAVLLRTQLTREKQHLQALTEDQLQIAKLEREIELQTTQYRKYAENLEQARIDHALELKRISNVSIVQPATYEREPTRPRKKVNLALGLLFALLSCAGLVWFLEGRRAQEPSSNAPLPQTVATTLSS